VAVSDVQVLGRQTRRRRRTRWTTSASSSSSTPAETAGTPSRRPAGLVDRGGRRGQRIGLFRFTLSAQNVNEDLAGFVDVGVSSAKSAGPLVVNLAKVVFSFREPVESM
jgi:hypothetical protein